MVTEFQPPAQGPVQGKGQRRGSVGRRFNAASPMRTTEEEDDNGLPVVAGQPGKNLRFASPVRPVREVRDAGNQQREASQRP